jgi:hypothetical protein
LSGGEKETKNKFVQNNIIVLSGNVVRINKMPRKKYKKRTCKKNQRDCGTKF